MPWCMTGRQRHRLSFVYNKTTMTPLAIFVNSGRTIEVEEVVVQGVWQ